MMASFVAGLVNPRFGATRIFHVLDRAMEVRTGQVGRIISGDEAGKFVRIDHDAEDTGGYLF
jgi:hypothetical protein